MESKRATSARFSATGRRITRFQLLAMVCLVGLALSNLVIPSASAKQVENFVGLGALVCSHDPGTFGGRDERLPDGCRWQAGVRLDLATSDGRSLGACVTGVDGQMCHLPAPFSSVVILRQDSETVPPGFAPKQNPVLRLVTANGMWIINVPQGLLPPTPSSAATLTIHSRFCSPGYEGSDYFATCHDTPPTYAQTFVLENEAQAGSDLYAATTDMDGNLTLTGLAPLRYRIEQGLPQSVEHLVVYCSRDSNPDDRVPADVEPWWDSIRPGGMFRTFLTLAPNDSVLCDFYAVPSAA